MSEGNQNCVSEPPVRIGKPTFSINSIRSGEQMSELIHKIGHDIGNPLTAIISIGSVIQTLTDYEQIPNRENKMPFYAESIINEAWRISRINERLVCLISQRPGAPVACDIKAAFMQALMRFKNREKKKYKPIDLNIHCSGPVIDALIDANQLNLLISELISNAVEAMERDKIKQAKESEFLPIIDVRITRDSSLVYFFVSSETSEPVPLELSNCFNPLVTGFSEEKRIGLGLTVVAVICERFNGKVLIKEEKIADKYKFTAELSFPAAN